MENKDYFEKYLERIALALENISSTLNKLISNNEPITEKQNSLEKKELEITTNNAVNQEYTEKAKLIENDCIIDFLKEKNIQIKHIKSEDEADLVLDKIALFIGNRYDKIKDFYKQIKSNMNLDRKIFMDLSTYKQEEISSITQLATNLYKIAFLKEYKYSKSPSYKLQAKVNRIPKALNFFSGGWLERYIKTTIIENIKNLSVSYSYIKNPQIILPNNDDFELDILFCINNEIFWIEAKTGEYQRYIDKYSKISKILNLDYEHSFMILTDIDKNTAENLKALFNMSVFRIDDFSDYFKNYISTKF